MRKRCGRGAAGRAAFAIPPVRGTHRPLGCHDAGVPPGVFNLVNGDGPTVGEALSAHPGVDMVSSANNHAFDYGSGGILETLAHVGRADIAVATHAGPERTASTKTYTAGLAAAHLVVAHLTGKAQGAANDVRVLSRTVDALIRRMAAEAAVAARHLGHTAPLTVIGRGDSYASAAMAALLTEEAAKLPCEALTGGQFRHGPLELVRGGFRAVVYLGEGAARPLTEALVDRIAALGGRVVAIGTNLGPATDAVLPIDLPQVAAGLLPVLEILPVQFLVIPLAIARGFEPAAFLNAQKITTGE